MGNSKPSDYITPAGGLLADGRPNPKLKGVADLVNMADTAEDEFIKYILDDMDTMAEGTGVLQLSRRDLKGRYERLSAQGKTRLSKLLEESETLEKPNNPVAISTLIKPRTPTRRSRLTNFTIFRDLPREIRIMIWTLALPNVIEAVATVNHQNTFLTPGPRSAIFTICYDYHNLFHMSPIYLPRPVSYCNGSYNWEKGVPFIWLRPSEDILYLNTDALYGLDIPAFLKIEANQALQAIALPAVHIDGIRWCGTKTGRVPGTRTWLGELVRGLRNLKTLYVVEGHTLHNESEVEYWGPNGGLFQHSLRLVDCKSAYETQDWAPGSNRYTPPARPWNQEYAVDVTEKFKDEVSREMSGKYPILFPVPWNVPEVVCKEIKRTSWNSREI